ncbi:GAF domain-containing protein, partial [Roseiarcus sp.]|uniref:GAF domain-containing protein n=1 Tax=Roseiarcus sp. TaxID=1969460 RepID=UPI003D0D76E8
EVQARTRDLEASLEQQTATADVLKAISRSAFDLETVLESLISTAMRLCNAKQGVIFRRHGDIYRYAASHMLLDPAYRAHEQTAEIKAGRGTLIGRVALENRTVQIEDAWGDPDYAEKDEIRRTKVRSMLGAPLLRNGEPIGAFGLGREEPVPFTQRQIELVTTFADQAVIAIENVRLFDEVQAKTRDLEESLEQQTATADVLKAISRTAFDLDTVLQTLISTAVRLCDASGGEIFRRHGDVFRYAASLMDLDPAYLEHEQKAEIRAGRGTLIGRVAVEKRTVEIADAWNDPEYAEKEEVRVGGVRAMLGVPLMRNGELIGAFALGRPAPVPFTKRQVELVTTFADQAVIAIENVRLFDEVQAKTRDLTEALQQQTATAEVLKVISRSAFDLDTVTATILQSAMELCKAPTGLLHLRDGDVFRMKLSFGHKPEVEEINRQSPIKLRDALHAHRPVRPGDYGHYADMWNDPDYRFKDAVKLADVRSGVVMPMFRGDEVIGLFSLARREPGPFTPRQIKLVQTFADQAAIAIENVRLFNEVKARTEDLSEALQQQTATADVLKVISRSVFDLQTVLDTLVESAYVLCGAGAALLYLRSDDGFECKAIAGAGAEDVGHLFKGRPIRAGRSTAAERVIRTGEVHSITDLFDDPDVDPKVTAGLRGARLDFRSTLAVPMKRDDAVVGVLVIARGQTGPFPQRQVDLLQTFADVLKVISRSMLDLDSVLQTLIDTAVRLARGSRGTIFLQKGDALVASAFHSNVPDALREYLANASWRLDEDTPPARAAREGHVVHIADLSTLDDENTREVRKRAPYGAGLWVPLIGERQTIGVFGVPRDEPIAFTDREIEIVQTFADQAVIAIENARLFEEVQARTRDLTEALQMQTATSDVLKVISRSAFDLQTVFNTLVSSAVELGGALTGTICVRDGDVFRYRDTIGAEHTSALAQYLKDHPATPGRSTIAGRVLLSGKVERIPDCLADPEYVVPMGSLATNVRSLLGVPLLRKEGVEGAIILTRAEPGEFTDRQIEIVQTFADQAVIALENVRLFDEVQARTRELAASLDDLRKAQDRLVQSEKLASLGQLTAGIAHEIKNPLNFVNNFSALSRELVGELAGVIKAAPLDDARREEAEELIGTIEGNLDKVVSHGKRADSIVKNMLLHSREGSGERSTTNVNAMVEEALNLAYHGARAEKPGFNVTIAKSLDPNAGAADLYPQEMTRVLLNLISNGFYATNKRKLAEPNGAYEPTLTASTRDLGQSVEIAIRDNGTGIADEVKAKMFNPFFTTKPAGEGTGLGLSLSHDIVVKQHGGTMEVESAVGAFTQFTIILPRAGEGL